MFDITSGDSNHNTTCIMKEIEISRNLSKCYLRAPINNGTLLMEIGYRNPLGVWQKIASSILDLEKRVASKNYFDESWFGLSNYTEKNGIHETMYGLSKGAIGGSENINYIR